MLSEKEIHDTLKNSCIMPYKVKCAEKENIVLLDNADLPELIAFCKHNTIYSAFFSYTNKTPKNLLSYQSFYEKIFSNVLSGAKARYTKTGSSAEEGAIFAKVSEILNMFEDKIQLYIDEYNDYLIETNNSYTVYVLYGGCKVGIVNKKKSKEELESICNLPPDVFITEFSNRIASSLFK